MTSASVVFHGVTKRFGDTVAVAELDLRIDPGEFVVLVGPSGCGKTTALRMIAGLEDPSEGRVLIGDDDVTTTRPRDRDVAMVFQSYALYPHLTVRQNLAFPLRQRRVPAAEIDRRVRETADLLELGPLLDRLPKQLSGGQRQRVAVGRAIVRAPRVFLMDEPLSNLDAQLRVRARAELASLHRRLGTTVCYVTHDQVEAMTMGDRIVVLRDGVLQQVGTPQEVYDNPANAFVGTFVGSPAMSLLAAHVLDHSDGCRLRIGDWELRAPEELVLRLAGRTTFTLGLRPEHVHAGGDTASGSHPDGPLDGVAGTVELVEPLGSDLYASVIAGETRVWARLSAERRLRVGDTLRLVPDLRRAHVFDPEHGLRIG